MRHSAIEPSASRALSFSDLTPIPRFQYTQCLSPSRWGTSSAARGNRWRTHARFRKKARGNRADFLICPDNTFHRALPYVAPPEAVVAAAARGIRRLGLIGTRLLVDGQVYPEKLATRVLEYVRPTPDGREEINRIIMEELICGVCKGGGGRLPSASHCPDERRKL